MSIKNHPVLFVLLILGAVGLFIGVVLTVLITFSTGSQFSLKEKIGVITIQGVITQSQPTIDRLIRFREDPGIKAIIIRIDSPGGGVGPSQEIYREVRKTLPSKKVIVSMGSLAASGGYYIAAAADKIVCNPGTLTGSIGVIMQFFQAEELMKKIGIDLSVIKSGELKDIGSPHRKMTEMERQFLNDLILDVQEQFIQAVAEGRGLPVEKIRPIADGRIMTGAQAKKLGLVDQLGNFEDAVDLAKELSGIKGEPLLIYPKKEKMQLIDLFFEKAAAAVIRTSREALEGLPAYRWDGPVR